MKTLNLIQGSDEWKLHRLTARNASEASMMMGVHNNVSRDDYLHMKATGTEQEFSAWVQKNILDNGHEAEANARPIIEKRIDDELFPLVGESDDGYLSASLDGLTMLTDTHWECKQWNKQKVKDVEAGNVPECDFWQVVQCNLVSGAEKSIYTVSDGTEENTISVEYVPYEKDFKRLLAGWAQFDKDLAEYKAKLQSGDIEQPVEAQAEVIKDLPAITYKMNGLALTSNLKAFEQQALMLIEKSREPLVDDSDFATAEKLVKVFKTAEDKLDGLAEQVVGEVQDIDGFTKDLKFLKEQIRQARLDADKQVKSEKERRKQEIINKAESELTAFMSDKNALLESPVMPKYFPDFAGALKGKKTIASLQSAANDELAKAKIDVSQMFDEIQRNFKTLNELAADHKFLFADLQQIISKEEGDFTALVKSRIADHKEAEQKRLKAERERIRAEEEAKAARQAEADRLEQERLRREQEEKQQLADAPEASVQSAPVEAEQQPVTKEQVDAAMDTKPQDKPVSRPSNAEMVQVIADHYGVKPIVAAGWLKEMAVAA